LGVRRAAIKYGVPSDPRASRSDLFRSAKSALPALATPIIIMGGIIGGVMTPTEAGAVGAMYTLLVGMFGYRELRVKHLPAALAGTARTTGVVMLVMATANSFAWILAFEGFPRALADTITEYVTNPIAIMILLVVVLLLVGTFIDT